MKVERLYKEYNYGGEVVTACDHINFDVVRGDFILIMGPSGSGKSTLLNLLAGIDKPMAGTIFYQDKPHHILNDTQITLLRRQFLGLIFQSFELIAPMSVRENIEYPLLLIKVDRRQRQQRIAEIATLLGIDHILNRPLKKISGGQKQRVAVARSLVLQPQILLGDEITGNLDHKTSQKIYRLLANYNQQQQQTIILVSHDLAARDYAKTVYHLEDGKLRAEQ